MPTNILLQSSKFYTQYKNGDTFTDNPSDTTINLAASVGEKIKLVQQIDIDWFFQASTNNPVDFENLGSDLFRYKKTNGGSFLDDGFNTNGTIDVISGGATISGTITNVSSSWMYIQFSSTVTTASGQTVSALFRGTTDQTTLIYKYGIIENNEGFNTLSKVTQHQQSYYAVGMTEGGGSVTMIAQGNYKDWQTGSATAERLSNPSTYVQRFEITHTFVVTPYFIDGELSNLQNNVLPSVFQNNQSLKYAFSTEFRDSLSYVGSAKNATIDYNLGACGWFNQNFNGFANDYAIESVTYEDDASVSADGVLINSNSVITVEVSKTSGSFVATDKIGAIISYLPESVDYQDKTTDLLENFMYDNNYCLAGGVPVAGSGIITETSATVNGSGNIELVIKTTYSTAQRATLTNKANPNFLLAINVGDITTTNANSDRVVLIADAIEYDKNADISGLMTLTNFRHFQHDDDLSADGWTKITAWNEDGLTSKFSFELDTNNDAFINTLKLGLYALDPSTLERFPLDTFEIPLSTASVVSNGIQEIEYTSDRNYILNANTIFNEISITTVGEVGGIVTYEGRFSQKMSWQDWILNLDADTIFYDNTKPNNNLNYKSSNYANAINNHKLYFTIDANVSGTDSTTGVSGATDYLLVTRDITTYDYDEDGEVTPIWSATIETFDETETTNLGGAILTDGSNTLMKITWENSVNPVVSAANFWAIHRIEVTGQQGYDIIELSSIRDYKTGELLIPISGSSYLDVSVVSGDIVTKCLIDGSKVSSNNSYNLSGRLQNPNKEATTDLIYYTNDAALGSINSTITKSGSTAVWDYGDGTALDTTNNGVHSYLGAGKFFLVTIEVDSFANVTGWELDSDKVYGDVDLTNLISLTSFSAQSNNNLTNVFNPTHSNTMVNYDISGCTAVASLDVSGLTGLGGAFDCNGCNSLATLTLPTSSQTFSNFDVRGSDVVDAELTTLTNLTESNGVTIDLGNTATTAAQTNKYLVDLDSMSSGSFTGRTITIDGTCAAPDGSSGGYDGTTAKANLITKGFTVTTN